MEIGEPVAPPALTDVKDDCPFDHTLNDPPTITNDLIGKGSTLATNMNNGDSTKLYGDYKPDASSKVTWGKLPQKDSGHAFYKKGLNKGRCLEIIFDDGDRKKYPVSCSAHHLVPSQESLKGHKLLEYMCKKGSSGANNHSFGGGVVWSDVGYDTNGSENGVYLPGTYAVGGGVGGLSVWYPVASGDDEEHDDGYIDAEKLPPAEYRGFELMGKRGEISTDNACWHYVAQAMKMSPGQFHDRHLPYSELVQKGLQNIYLKYKKKDVTIDEDNCGKCKDRQKKLKKKGLPAPYSVVNRLEFMSKKLRGFLKAGQGSWRKNVYTSEWCNKYMESVLRGGKARHQAEAFE